MCGIAGMVGAGDTLEAVERMSRALRHRGPDDGGQVELRDREGRSVGAVAARRLAILDLSPTGHQPMISPDGRYTLVYNGEIYNHRELRQRLAAQGEAFEGSSDTEVLLKAWSRLGAGTLSDLRGMYAFAIWDRDTATATLVRDPLGIKPLYYAVLDDRLVFASEVRALLRSAAVPGRLSSNGVRSYLAGGAVADPGTIIEGIHSLPAGHVLEVRVGASGGAVAAEPRPHPGAGPERWFQEGGASSDLEVALRRFREVLRESVERHLISDVPVAFLLSGGIDSTALVSLAASLGRRDLETFTVRFQAGGFDEGSVAREVAAGLGTSHHEVAIADDTLIEMLPRAFRAMDQPTIDGFNTWMVSRAIHEAGLKVAISGLGGDELFGGYPSFRRASRYAGLWGAPAFLRRGVSRALRWAPALPAGQLSDALAEDDAGAGIYIGSRTLFDRRWVRILAREAAERRVVPLARVPLTRQVRWLELSDYMRNMLLRDVDGFSMAASLETRVPFVDVEVVQATLRFEEAAMANGGRPKALLVQALRDEIPQLVQERKKRGFEIPYESWLRGALRGTIEAGLSEAGLERVGIRPRPARKLWEWFRSGKRGVGWSRPWSLYVLVRWAEENDVYREIGGT